MNLTGSYLNLIAERRRGLFFDLIRAALAVLSVPYASIIILRNAYYDLSKKSLARAACPVISIGNITTGGTGKTPMTVLIAARLFARNRKVAILLRGYKASRADDSDSKKSPERTKWASHSDEALLLKRRCPQAVVLANPDRTEAAHRAVAEGADVIVLDDGFQHRKLARDLDIVLIDATTPFGHGYVLPRGLLREPASSLRRADLIVLTRSNEIDQATRNVLLGTLRRVSGGKPIVEASHQSAGLMDIKGRPAGIDDCSGVQAVIFAGIGNFDSFRRSVEKSGVRVLAAYQYPDHHAYSDVEIQGLQDVAAQLEANAVITTEKDAVKLVGRWNETAGRLLVVQLEISIDAQGEQIIDDLLTKTLSKK